MIELIVEMGEIYLWCLNKGIVLYKFINKKVRYLGDFFV